ncbi:MAG: hypothetical protein ACFFFT_05505 [Candidatus Thorarchaeota archaeon]
MPIRKQHIKKIFKHCYSKLSREKNTDIYWYLHERPKTITRENFFIEAGWAIWVSGMKRKSTKTFMEKASNFLPLDDYEFFAKLSKREIQNSLKKIHGKSIPPRAAQKWLALYDISKILSNFKNEKDFRASFFEGKYYSRLLNNEDITRLRKLSLPFIGKANSQMLIRNLGGESIKCDRWIRKFLDFYKIEQTQLYKILKEIKVKPGLFDIVLWSYCEQYIGRASLFDSHFIKILSK